MGQLTLVTGIPGTRIRQSLLKFSGWSAENHEHDIEVLSVEELLKEKALPLFKEYFSVDAVSVVQIFSLPRPELRRVWSETWKEVLSLADELLTTSDVILTFHFSYFHHANHEYFIAADLHELTSELRDRSATIITLIDDIFDCHQALVAGGSASGMLGVPTSIDDAVLELLQILEWRSIEVMLSESLASSTGSRHHVLGVKHPISTMYYLLFNSKPVVYFSHPISEPRRLEAAGKKDEAIQLINKMSEVLSRIQAYATVIEPTSIDELRFRDDSGNLNQRWPLGPDRRELVYERPEALQHPSARDYMFPVGWQPDGRASVEPTGLIRHLAGAIAAQINARDHGLVEQSEVIAAYRPIYGGNVSHGVQEELRHHARLVASGLRTPGASIVFSPPGDLSEYPRRRLADFTISSWAERGLIRGDSEAVGALRQQVLADDSDLVREVLRGSADALMRMVTTVGLDIQPDAEVLATGALGTTEIVRQQAAAGQLAEQVKRLGDVYFDELAADGTVKLVETEQMFYDALQEVTTR